MKSEELFDIDRQINQIKRDLEQRKQKIAQWDVPLAHILKDRTNKEFYLSKKYSESNLQHYLAQANNPTQAQQLLKRHNQTSQQKVHHFKNELRELQELTKKKSVFRLPKANRFTCKVNLKQQQTEKNVKKEFSKTKHQSSQSLYRKHNHESSFSTLKAQKLLQVYLQAKNSKENNGETMGHVKRYLGIGLQSTPFFGWTLNQSMPQNKSSDKTKNMIEGQEKQGRHPLRGLKQLKQQIELRSNIYLSKGNHKRQQFQQRLKRVIRYNQEGVRQILLQANMTHHQQQ